jgi:hypothetical protein
MDERDMEEERKNKKQKDVKETAALLNKFCTSMLF